MTFIQRVWKVIVGIFGICLVIGFFYLKLSARRGHLIGTSDESENTSVRQLSPEESREFLLSRGLITHTPSPPPTPAASETPAATPTPDPAVLLTKAAGLIENARKLWDVGETKEALAAAESALEMRKACLPANDPLVAEAETMVRAARQAMERAPAGGLATPTRKG